MLYFFAQAFGRHAVFFLKQLDKITRVAKADGVRDLGDGQVGAFKQHRGEESDDERVWRNALHRREGR